MRFGNLQQYHAFKEEDDIKVFTRHITDFLENHYIDQKDNKDPLVLDLNDMARDFPVEFNIIDNWGNDYDQMLTLFRNIVWDWGGSDRKIFFNVPTGLIDFQDYFNLTSDYNDRIIKIKATVDVIKEFMDIPLYYNFKCKLCGEKYENRINIVRMCKCGSKSLNQKVVKYISRRYIDLSDPNQTQGSCVITGYIDLYSKQDLKIIPDELIGQDLEVMGLLRLVKKPHIGFVREFEIIGMKPDRLRGLKKDRIQEIVETVRKDKCGFINIAMDMNKNIKGMDYIKLLFFACSVGLKYPDPQFKENHIGFNAMVIGSPAISKSKIMENMTRYFYKSRKVTAKSISRAGLIGGIDAFKGSDKKNIVAGEISRCNDGVLFIDECKHLADDVKHALLTSMSDGWHTIKFSGINFKFRYNTNIVLIGNPKEGILMPETPLYDQVDFDPEFLSRCHITTKAEAYYKEKQGSINMEKLNEVFEVMRINDEDQDKLCQAMKYDEQFLRDYANAVKIHNNPKLTQDSEIKIEEYIRGFADKFNSINTFHDSDDHVKSNLDMRSLVALKILSKIIARAEFSNKVEDRHIKWAIDLYNNTMIEFRQVYNMEMPDIIEEEMIEKNKKVYPKTKREKRMFVLNQVPRGDVIDGQDLLEKCVNYGISEAELDEIIGLLSHDIYEPKNGQYSKL